MAKQIIQTNKEADSFNRKRVGALIVVLASISVVAIISLILVLLKVETVYTTLITFFLLIGLLFIVFSFKPKVMYYAMQYRYHLLLANSIMPYIVNEKFNKKWIDSLIADHFVYGYKHDVVDILFKVSKPVERSAFHNNHVLEIITVIKDNSIDFYSDLLNDQYKKIWNEYQAKYRISKQVILQFKKYNSFNEEIKTDLDRVIAFREGTNYLITINCGYFEKEQTVYYLHSDTYYPNLYYKYAVENIKAIVK